MKVLNKGERQYLISGVLIKPQQTADIDDKYKSVVESYKEFEIVEPEAEVEPEVDVEVEPEVEVEKKAKAKKTNKKK
tara:strand:- start:3208 stop:3438 length:231 start_codon:yes stop_codon:yes gene_type:complete